MPPHVPPPGFAVPDFTAPLDIAAIVAAAPSDSSSKGMFLQGIVDRCAAQGRPVQAGPYVAFKDYSTGEHIRLLAAAAAALYPDVPLREGLRRIGETSYETLASTLIGKVVFGVLGKDIRAITKITPKAYEIAGRGVRATILEHSANHSHISLEGNVALASCYHYGAFEGVLTFCGVVGRVWCKAVTAADPAAGVKARVDMFTVWNTK